jgi:uncharacterized protein YegL
MSRKALIPRLDQLPLRTKQEHSLVLPEGMPLSNAQPTLMSVIIKDCSGSMAGRPIRQINRGLAALPDFIEQDELTANYVSLALIRCGGCVSIEQAFVRARDFQAPTLEASGGTPLAESLLVAIDLIEEHQRVLDEWGFDQHRMPWILLATDGRPTDSRAMFDAAARRVRQMEHDRRLAVFAAVTDDSDTTMLRDLVVREPKPLRDFDFLGMMRWFAASMRSVSHSRVGEVVHLPPPDDFGWTQL